MGVMDSGFTRTQVSSEGEDTRTRGKRKEKKLGSELMLMNLLNEQGRL
jgi:hypothetical protein